jgi:uncharacterized cupin superfamily protein
VSVRVFNLLDGEVGEGEDVDVFVHRRAGVRHDLGAELIGCSLYEVPPGKRAWPYHHHDNNEEWLVVVDGRPTLRTPEGERELEPGDVAGFPQGEAGAHDISNRGDEPVRVAIFSTLRQGSVVYPDSDKIGAGPPWDRRYFRRADAVDYWDGEASE